MKALTISTVDAFNPSCNKYSRYEYCGDEEFN